MTELAPSVLGSPADGLGLHLSPEEDDVLRRLHYLSQHGPLSDEMRQKMLELRLRDRRRAIRPPREFEKAGDKGTAPRRGWGRKLFRRA